MELQHPQVALPAWISVLFSLGQQFQKTTLMGAVPPSHLGLSKPGFRGFRHTVLAFCHLRAPHFSLAAAPAASCSDISLLLTLMDRYVGAPGKCLFPFKHSRFVVISRKNEWTNMQVVTGSC